MKFARPRVAKQSHGAIDRVALADAAEMNAHARSRDEGRAGGGIEDHRAVVDERQPRGDLFGCRDVVVLVVIELPDIGQRTERDVELP